MNIGMIVREIECFYFLQFVIIIDLSLQQE